MSYDNWKLMTPPDYDKDICYEYCDACNSKFESEDLYNVLIDLEPFTLCKSCKNKAESNNL
jgi:hypothetical protein